VKRRAAECTRADESAGYECPGRLRDPPQVRSVKFSCASISAHWKPRDGEAVIQSPPL